MPKAPRIPATDEAWESEELGASELHAKQAPRELESNIDDHLDLQAISIRLPKSMIDDYKYIAGRECMKYQTLMKQALLRFAVSEMKKIAGDMEREEQRVRAIASDRPRVRRAAGC